MRVVIVHKGAFPGHSGAEAMAVAVARQAVRMGHAVIFVTDPRSIGRAGHLAPGVGILDIRSLWAEEVRRWRPDVIHLIDLVSASTAIDALDASRACNSRFVVTPASAAGTWEEPEIGQRALSAAAGVLVLTRAEARQLTEMVPGLSRIVVIGQGGDLPEINGSAAEFRVAHGITGPMILFLGRRLRSKGLWRLVAAMPRVRNRIPDAVLVVAGPEGDDCCLDPEHQTAGIIDLGLVSDAEKCLTLEACDLFCLPTDLDVFPVSFVEAWKCAKAVATGRFAGVEEVVRVGTDGVIIDSEPSILADELVELLLDAPRLARLGEAGRERAIRELSWTAVGERIDTVYQHISVPAYAAPQSQWRAVILAGGLGRRLRADRGGEIKPLVPIGGFPIIELLLRQLAAQGFERATLCITPTTDAIQERIGDGSQLGMAVDYSRSEKLLGTAGPLRLIDDWEETVVVLNGDLLTSIDYAAIRRWHVDRGCAATIVLYRPAIPVPFAVVEMDAEGYIRNLDEKPTLRPLCACGIYVLEPEILQVLGDGEIDMPEALLRLLRSGRLVCGVEVGGRWHDIGTPEALRLAELDFRDHITEFLPALRAAKTLP